MKAIHTPACGLQSHKGRLRTKSGQCFCYNFPPKRRLPLALQRFLVIYQKQFLIVSPSHVTAIFTQTGLEYCCFPNENTKQQSTCSKEQFVRSGEACGLQQSHANSHNEMEALHTLATRTQSHQGNQAPDFATRFSLRFSSFCMQNFLQMIHYINCVRCVKHVVFERVWVWNITVWHTKNTKMPSKCRALKKL